ncbi:MAG: lysophospholipid acyltransferase family protein [Nitrospinota bacterium]|nr:lysophospholipid acyltransferase family protein [Nitrospinota bacterium]
MKSFLLNNILPPILWAVIHLWCKTIRVKILNPEMEKEIREKPGRAVYTFWHSRQFYIFYHFRGLHKYHMLVSPSKDGDILANVGKWFGYKVVRGSSFKRTLPGTRECIDLLNKDAKVVIIADGSRGPYHLAQQGSVQLARITGAPIYALTYDAHPKHEFSSWDRSILPLPFSKVTLNYAPPMTVPPDADKETIRQKQDELTGLLNKITQECAQS